MAKRSVALPSRLQTTLGQGIDDTLRKEGYNPSEVAGYPAARAQEVPGQACGLTVGVNDTAKLVLAYQRRAGQSAAQVQPCPYVESIAAKVTENLPLAR